MSGGPVHVAWRAVDALIAGMPPPVDWLSASERTRLDGLASPQRRGQFLAARWLARLLLSRARGGDPHEWRLSAPEQGPPTLEDAGRQPALHLAISHSANFAACAVGPQSLGLDIEAPRRARDTEGLAAMCCGASERAMLRSTPPADQAALFYQLWCVKEAWIKRHGQGVAPARLRQIELSLAPGPASTQAATWSGPGCTLALCAPQPAAADWWGAPPPLCKHWRVRDRGLTPA